MSNGELEVFNFFDPDKKIWGNLCASVFMYDYDSTRAFMASEGFLWTEIMHRALEKLLDEAAGIDLNQLDTEC